MATWYWNAAPDPFAKGSVPDWKKYSKLDNDAIEKAFGDGSTRVDLSNHTIHLKERMQISKADYNKQRPVKRESP